VATAAPRVESKKTVRRDTIILRFTPTAFDYGAASARHMVIGKSHADYAEKKAPYRWKGLLLQEVVNTAKLILFS
jgi:hypothetical protein